MRQYNKNSIGSTSTERRAKTTDDEVKLPMFQGNGAKDPKKYWFLCEEVWMIKQVKDEDIKKGQLATTFQGRTLDGYIIFLQVLIGKPQKMLPQIRAGLIKKFENPKLEL